MQQLGVILAFMLLASLRAGLAAEREHLIILSGQSNMAGLDPASSFLPTLKLGLPNDGIVVVQDAKGGAPIRRWYRDWRPEPSAPIAPDNGDLYRRLTDKIAAATQDRHFDTVTFVWMQGEKDSRGPTADVYQASLAGLIEQLRDDLDRPDMLVVIGRLSDHDAQENAHHWQSVRQAQVAVAEADPRAAWVDTDDLNGSDNNLHYTESGYRALGARFAAAALRLIAANEP